MLKLLRLAALVLVALLALVLTRPADVLDWIAGAFNDIASIPGEVVKTIWAALRGVFHFASGIFDAVGSAWSWMVNGIEWLGSRAAWLGETVWSGMTWLVTRWVPMAAHWALGKAAALAYGLWNSLRHWVTGLANSIIHFFKGAINTVKHWATAAFNWVFGKLSAVFNWIAHATWYVFELVAHPERLANWVAAHVLQPVLSWFLSSGEAVARWLLKQLRGLALDVAHLLEDVISAVL